MGAYPSIGNVARLSCSFTDDTNTLADPTTVTVMVNTPNGVSTETPDRDSTGEYHYDLSLTTPGEYTYRFVGTGAIEAQSADTQFFVPPETF